MMLRCAAFISSGSALAIPLTAPARAPRVIASSTVRTELRIWVRRDLLMMVRRAILRVAFLAEVVLAMFSNSCRDRRGKSGLNAPAVQPHDLGCGGLNVFPANAVAGAKWLTSRHRSKNSGGRFW